MLREIEQIFSFVQKIMPREKKTMTIGVVIFILVRAFRPSTAVHKKYQSHRKVRESNFGWFHRECIRVNNQPLSINLNDAHSPVDPDDEAAVTSIDSNNEEASTNKAQVDDVNLLQGQWGVLF